MMVFALAIALPLMVLTVITTDWYVAAERARLQTMGQLTGDHLRERLDRDLSEMSAMARTLATSPSIDAQDWARFDAQGRALVDTTEFTVSLTRFDGRHIVNTRVPAGQPMPTSPRPDIVAALLATRLPVISSAVKSAVTGADIILICAPVLRGGPPDMYVSVAMRVDHFAPLIAQAAIDDSFAAVFVDGAQHVIARTSDVPKPSASPAGSPFPPMSKLQLLEDWEKAEASVMEFRHRSGVSDWTVVTGLDRDAFEVPLRRSLVILSLLAFALLGSGGIVAWLYARQVAKAVRALRRAVKAIGRGETVEPPSSQIREVNQIGLALVTAARVSAEQRATIAEANALLEVRVAERGRELAASQAHYQLLAETMTDVVILRHADWRIAYVSPSGAALFGTEGPDFDPRARIHPDDLAAFSAADARLGPDRPSIVSLFRMRHADGRCIWIEAVNDLLTSAEPGDPNVISTLRDVTKRQDQADELRMARDAAELAQAKAENASRAKSEFMGLVSHEIRTPLTTIKGFTDLLAHTTGLSTDQVRYLALVGAATDSLIGTVDDVLDYARAGQGDLRLDRVPLDFPALVKGAADLVRPMAEARGVAIDVTVTCEGSRRVLGDERRLRQILLNLLQDAIGTLRRGSVALALQGPRGGEPVERWRVSVTAQADEDPEQAASRTVALDGSGLGFIIAQRLVGLMGGGRIDRSTPLGEAAAYRFSLSLAPAPVLTDAAPAPSPAATGAGRILVVEDNPINREVVQAMLHRLGYGVDMVADGEAGIRAVQASAYDLVLMDVSLPGMDGTTAIRRIRSLQHPARRVPIVAMSANLMPDRVRDLTGAGANGYLGKPFDLPTLSRAVAEQISSIVLRERDESMPMPERPPIFDRAAFDALIAEIGAEAAREAVRAFVRRLDHSAVDPGAADGESLAAEADRTGFRDLAKAYRTLAALSPGAARDEAEGRCRVARDLMNRMVHEITGPTMPEIRQTVALL
ncbi:response regulator [Methylobacterium sp. WCS2018Hpa-22]|uniref:response regulator n=1 Tax=Methylobacterium sp. WCS2018Hpa-22 TaxID=3073633 RepID=UPI002889EBA6|nr:response regulator [Methylobacterium sp. WCS2018Hpa-22]